MSPEVHCHDSLQRVATFKFMMDPQIQSTAAQVGPESGGFWPPSSQIDGIDTRNFDRAL